MKQHRVIASDRWNERSKVDCSIQKERNGTRGRADYVLVQLHLWHPTLHLIAVTYYNLPDTLDTANHNTGATAQVSP